MDRIAIIGGSGYFGQTVIEDFVKNEYEVVNIDIKLPAENLCRTIKANIVNLGEAYGSLREANVNAVVNLAAIPVAYRFTDEVTIKTNIMTTYNVLEAAASLGIEKIATASSDSSYGLVFSRKKVSPMYLLVDENHPQIPEDPYGFSKLVNEETAKMINRRYGVQIVCLRFVCIETCEHYDDFYKFNRDLDNHMWEYKAKELWNYVDMRDAARACRLAVEANGLGACAVNISADDTCMDIETSVLVNKYYPEVDIRDDINGYTSLTSNKKAKDVLGWTPVHSWRDGRDK